MGGATPPPTTPAIRPSGGFPSGDRGPTKKQTHRSKVIHGIILEVAKRQVQALDLDEIQKAQELREELRLRGIEAQIAHYEALSAERDRLISNEIAQLLKTRMDEDAIFVLMAIASAL